MSLSNLQAIGRPPDAAGLAKLLQAAQHWLHAQHPERRLG